MRSRVLQNYNIFNIYFFPFSECIILLELNKRRKGLKNISFKPNNGAAIRKKKIEGNIFTKIKPENPNYLRLA